MQPVEVARAIRWVNVAALSLGAVSLGRLSIGALSLSALSLSALSLGAPMAGAQESAVYRALALEDSGRWEEAAAAYRDALRTSDRVHAAFGLERALLTLGRPEELAEVLALTVLEAPDEPEIRAIYVRTLLGLERPAAARTFVEGWISQRPYEPEAYRQLYATGPISAAEVRAIWRRVRGSGGGDSAQVILDELAERVAGSGLWAVAREMLEERYARAPDHATAEQLALAAARAGELDRARSVAREAELSEESAARAWIALYEGDLVTARHLLRRADQADASAVLPLAVLSRTARVRSRELGDGVLWLARGDTARAVRMLGGAARDLPDAASLLLTWSARLSAARGDNRAADQLYETVARDYPDSPEAPEAVLAQARSRVRRADRHAAAERLEFLILTYPRSSLVPVARRELDALRGAVPPGGS